MKKIALKKMFVIWSAVTAISVFHAYALPKPNATRNSGSVISRTALAAMKIKNIEFEFNKAEVPAKSFVTLDRVAKLMVDNDAALKLGGYADNKGGYVYNWKLSKARADAVKNYLIKKGANESRIASTEYGFTKPIATNKTRSGRQKNRRVEVKFAG